MLADPLASSTPQFNRRGYLGISCEWLPLNAEPTDLNPGPGGEFRKMMIRETCQKQERRAGWPGSLSLICGERTGYVGCPRGSLAKTPLKLGLKPPPHSPVPNPECARLHHEGKILQFMLKNRQSTAGHFHSAHSIPCRLRRNPIAPAHQENLH